MTKATGTYRVDFKNPDFLYQSNAVQVTDDAVDQFADCGEYFSIEIEMDEDMKIHSARFVKP
jgi:hypothetical protein